MRALSAVGIIFCLLGTTGQYLPCESQGCSVYASYSFLGLSIYAWGAAGFLVILLARLLRPSLLTPILVAGLVIDTLFLAYQSFFWTCGNCYIAAILLGAIFLVHLVQTSDKRLIPAMAVWGIFFVVVGHSIVKERILQPWSLHGSPESTMQVYFSPTCPACKDMVLDLVESSGDKTAFIPVAKNEEDEQRIAAVLNEGLKGQEAVRGLFRETEGEAESLGINTRLQLAMNKSSLASKGISSVPTILTPSLPKRSIFPFGDFFSPITLSEPDDSCSFIEEEPCEDTEGLN